jgi:8-oxo-dGTP pyrophosphatase MutT (NUDIX family)
MKDGAPVTKIEAGLTDQQLAYVDRDPPRPGSGAPVRRPRDAATILVLDRSGEELKVLMGRRHHGHAFMPGKFVFPGGRTDPGDGSVPAATELDPVDTEKLLSGMGARATTRRVRALALAAIRETYEEAGLLLGRKTAFDHAHGDWKAFVERGVAPDLSALRFVARAITPPGRVRRFDTRFFVAFREAIAESLPEGTGPSGELEDLHWLTFEDAVALDLPPITRTILHEVAARFSDDPRLKPGLPVVEYRMRHRRFVRNVI